MKKAIALVLAAGTLLCFVACNRWPEPDEDYVEEHSVIFNGESVFLESLDIENGRVIFPVGALLKILGAEYADSELQAYQRSVFVLDGVNYVLDDENHMFVTEEEMLALMKQSLSERRSLRTYAEDECNLLATSRYKTEDENDAPPYIVWTPAAWADHVTIAKMFKSMGYHFEVEYNEKAGIGPVYVTFERME